MCFFRMWYQLGVQTPGFQMIWYDSVLLFDTNKSASIKFNLVSIWYDFNLISITPLSSIFNVKRFIYVGWRIFRLFPDSLFTVNMKDQRKVVWERKKKLQQQNSDQSYPGVKCTNTLKLNKYLLNLLDWNF